MYETSLYQVCRSVYMRLYCLVSVNTAGYYTYGVFTGAQEVFVKAVAKQAGSLNITMGEARAGLVKYPLYHYYQLATNETNFLIETRGSFILAMVKKLSDYYFLTCFDRE